MRKLLLLPLLLFLPAEATENYPYLECIGLTKSTETSINGNKILSDNHKQEFYFQLDKKNSRIKQGVWLVNMGAWIEADYGPEIISILQQSDDGFTSTYINQINGRYYYDIDYEDKVNRTRTAIFSKGICKKKDF